MYFSIDVTNIITVQYVFKIGGPTIAEKSPDPGSTMLGSTDFPFKWAEILRLIHLLAGLYVAVARKVLVTGQQSPAKDR